MQWNSLLSTTAIYAILFPFPFFNSRIAFRFCTVFYSACILLDLCYRQMLYELSENITNEMLKDIVFLLQNCLPKRRIPLVCEERAKCIYGGKGRRGRTGIGGKA